jgi:hypothetical protein
MSTKSSIALLLSGIVSTVLFGIGAVTVLSVPHLSESESAQILLPIVIVFSFVLAPMIAWVIAPWLRAQYSQQVASR